MQPDWEMITHFDIFSEVSRPFADAAESGDYLRGARQKFNVLNLSYWFLGASKQLPDRLTWLSTYDENYMSVYMRDYTPLGDPAFTICFDRLLPLDWAEIRDADNHPDGVMPTTSSIGNTEGPPISTTSCCCATTTITWFINQIGRPRSKPPWRPESLELLSKSAAPKASS